MTTGSEKEWDDFGRMPNLTIIPWLIWGVICGLVIAALFYSARLHAEPRFVASEQGVIITLFDDPCAITDKVANLPYKATWLEGGKEYAGCWGPKQDSGEVVAFFDDLKIAFIPVSVFKKAIGA